MLRDLLDLDHPLHWTIDGVLTEAECAELIERFEANGFELASIDRPGGPVIDQRTRNNNRSTLDDRELAALLYQRVRGKLPAVLNRWRIHSANERLRCYRYRPGQYFAPHYDGSFIRSDSERSMLTFMIYLNGGFEGGETNFLELGESVAPAAGRALVFQHPILHEGAEVTSGTKYAIRSDIMYRAASEPRDR